LHGLSNNEGREFAGTKAESFEYTQRYWEEKAVDSGSVLRGKFHYTLSNDDVLARIRAEELQQNHDDEKERAREIGEKYGFDRQLYSTETYDLSWLLELKDRGWLPDKIQLYNLNEKRRTATNDVKGFS
jgi:hypothetical protein